jgi:hypothetical protein
MSILHDFSNVSHILYFTGHDDLSRLTWGYLGLSDGTPVLSDLRVRLQSADRCRTPRFRARVMSDSNMLVRNFGAHLIIALVRCQVLTS